MTTLSTKKIQKPVAGEYAPYTSAYIDLMPDDGLVLAHLRANMQSMKDLFLAQSEVRLSTPCAAGEWTMKEILSHVTDTERVFACRALRIARNDLTPLPGFDQGAYTHYSGANARSSEDLLEEFSAVRLATLALFHSLDDQAWQRVGRVADFALSVRAAVYIIAGHERHHLDSIQQNYPCEN
ncbi:MAG TPA: DinB family protein [Ktedonobacteraceae bacterium]|jgi:hypothetical protein